MEFNPNTGELTNKNNVSNPTLEETLAFIKGKIETNKFFRTAENVKYRSDTNQIREEAEVREKQSNFSFLISENYQVCLTWYFDRYEKSVSYDRDECVSDRNRENNCYLTEYSFSLYDIAVVKNIFQNETSEYWDEFKYYSLVLETLYLEKSIACRSWNDTYDYTTVDKSVPYYYTDNIIIPFEDENMVNRIIKAFNHLRNLIGAKKEPF